MSRARIPFPTYNRLVYKTLKSPFPPFSTLNEEYCQLVKKPNSSMLLDMVKFKDLNMMTKQAMDIGSYINSFVADICHVLPPVDDYAGYFVDTKIDMKLDQVGFIHSALYHIRRCRMIVCLSRSFLPNARKLEVNHG